MLNGDFYFVSKIFKGICYSIFHMDKVFWKLCHGLYKIFETLTYHLECFSFYTHNLMFKITTVLPLSAFCTIISLFLRRIFNASNSTMGKFLSIVLPVSYDKNKESQSLLLIRSLSKWETSKESLYISSKGIKISIVYILRIYH